MKPLGKNDAESVYVMTPGQADIRICRLENEAHDRRAHMLFDMVKSWGAMAIMGDAVRDLHGHGCDGETPASPPRKNPTKQEIVMGAAEMVDAMWDEARRRGWVFDLDHGDE
jgi:hypothetical protein